MKVQLLWEKKQNTTHPNLKASFHLKKKLQFYSAKSAHQPGRIMVNFPDTDKSTTVDPKRHSGLSMSPIGPPSMIKDN